MILSCKDISKSFGVNSVLNSVSFLLEEKEKAAVVGVNGAGKTTLFKILTGELAADGGNVVLSKSASLGYMSQTPDNLGERTIYDEMLQVFEEIIELERGLRDMERRMSRAEPGELEPLMDAYAKATHEFEHSRGYEYKSRIRGVLRGLGFSEAEFTKPAGILSGGQKTRVALASLLLREPEVLLLDEPTNHLDLESVEWLEEFLLGYPGSVLIISHDRYFLDRVATKVIELENGTAVVYNGNYSHYAHKKEVDREIALKHYLDQQKEIKRQEAVIAKLRSYNREKSIKRAESREKLLSKLERVERPAALPDKMRLALTPKKRSGVDVLTAEGLSKGFGGAEVFAGVGFEIKRPEKVALIGPNGIGKTTLFKILQGELAADSGRFTLGQNVSIGCYDQEHGDLNPSKTVLGELSDSYPRLTVLELRNALAAFMFTGDDVHKPISALSGGERGRVELVKIMLSSANLLLLDEPTNHLDIYSREILENAICSYGGTVLYISHDRYFISRTAEKIIELTKTGAVTYMGGYEYYTEKKAGIVTDSPEPAAKDDRRRKRERDTDHRRAQNRLQRLEVEISELECEQKRVDELLHGEAGADFVRANELYSEKTRIGAELEALYDEWAELC